MKTAPVLRGLLWMLAIVLLGTLLAALILQYTRVSESQLPVFTYGINFISLLIGGYVTGKQAKERGWLYGGITGLLYGILLFIFSFLAFDATLTIKTFVSFVGASASAAIGGILGVNFGK